MNLKFFNRINLIIWIFVIFFNTDLVLAKGSQDLKTKSKKAQLGVSYKNKRQVKYRTLYVISYKDKFKTHEIKFMKDMHNHKNTALLFKNLGLNRTKKLSEKQGYHVEKRFSGLWTESKYRAPSYSKKCTTYVRLASLMGKQSICAENKKTAFKARNFLNELRLILK